MTSNPEETQPDLLSELIDLDGYPIASVRALNNAVVNRALQYVDEQASRPSKTETSCSSLSKF